MAGLLDNLTADPMFNLGAGLLASSGWSPRPVSFGQALGGGLLHMGQMNALNQRAALERMKMEQAQAEREQQIQRRQQIQGLLGQESDPMLRSLGAVDPDSYLKAKFEQAKPQQGTSLQQEYSQAVSQGFQGTILDYQTEKAKAGRSVIVNNTGDAVQDRPLTPEEAARFGIPDKAAPGMIVTGKGEIRTRPLTEDEKLQARTRESLRGGMEFISEYETQAKKYANGYSPIGEARNTADQSRDALVAWVAKNILGTPGAEPSPSLYERAEDLVPDFAGWYDRAMFDGKMATLKRLASAKATENGIDDYLSKYAPEKPR